MNNSACLIWASLFSSKRVKYQLTHPDGQVEVNSKVSFLTSIPMQFKIKREETVPAEISRVSPHLWVRGGWIYNHNG